MLIFLYSIVIITNFIFAFKVFVIPLNRSVHKSNLLIVLITFILFYLLMAGYRNNSGLTNDLLNNQAEYYLVNSFNISNYEPIFVFLMRVGGLLSLDFYSWRALMIFIALLILFVSALKWTPNPHFIFAMFGTNLLIQSSHLFRNFLALSLFFMGQCIYKYSESRYRKVFFITLFIFSGLIHASFLLYLPLLLIDTKFFKSNKHIIFYSVFFLCLLLFFFGSQIPGLNFIASKIGISRLDVYLQNRTTFGFILFILLHLLSLFSIFLIKKRQFLTKGNEISFNFQLISVIYYPLFMIDGTFIRLVRNLLLDVYSTQGEYLIDDIKDKRKINYIFFIIFFSISWVVVNYFVQSKPEIIFYPFFSDNIYFK
ncbi:TPA: EpsG family protein [Streptococcus suis]